jgi:AraC-like DNA-binding protein
MEAGFRGFHRKLALEEGDSLLIPPDMKFRGTGQSQQTSIWVVHFTIPSANSPRKLRHFRHSAGDAFARGLLTEISSVYRKSQGAKCNPYLNSLVTALLEKVRNGSAALSVSERRDPRLHFVRVEDIESLGNNPLPSVSKLAASAGLSTSHYRALFKKQFGITPGKHLLQLRLVYARKLLKDTRLPIKQVAASTGYGDPVSFHRAFLSACGISPARFRRNHPRTA